MEHKTLNRDRLIKWSQNNRIVEEQKNTGHEELKELNLFRFRNIHEEIVRSNRKHRIKGRFFIWLFGSNQIGESIGIRVQDYKPWFYIDLLPDWLSELEYDEKTGYDTLSNQQYVNDSIVPVLCDMLEHVTTEKKLRYPLRFDALFDEIKVVGRIPMIGFTNFQVRPLLKIYFKNIAQYTYNQRNIYDWFTCYPPFRKQIKPYHLNQNKEADYNLLDKFIRDTGFRFQTWYNLNFSNMIELTKSAGVNVQHAYSMNICHVESMKMEDEKKYENVIAPKTLKIFVRIMPLSQFGCVNRVPYAPDCKKRHDVISCIACTYQWSDSGVSFTTVKTIFEDVESDEFGEFDMTLETYPSEQSLLSAFAQEFNDCDPDCVFVYNDVLLTTHYLEYRMNVYNIHMSFERVIQPVQPDRMKMPFNINRSRSRDYINITKMLAKKLATDIYDIRFMAQYSQFMPKNRILKFSELKQNEQYPNLWSILAANGKAGRTTVVKGVFVEVDLMKAMENHVSLLEECQATSKCQFVISSESCNRGEQYRVQRLIVNGAMRDNYFVNRYEVLRPITRYSMTQVRESYPIDEESPGRRNWVKNGFNNQGTYSPMFKKSKTKKKTENRGGYVHDPIPGYYAEEEISGVLDFKSLYPSIMVCYTFSPDTIVWNPIDLSKLTRRDDDMYDHEDFPGIPLQACRVNQKELIFVVFDKRAILGKILSTLLKERKIYKGMMKKFPKGSQRYVVYNMAQLTTKVTCNATYGFFNVSNEKGNAEGGLVIRDLSLIVTAIGRSRICLTRTYLREKYGIVVIYGDTDSVFIYFKHPPTSQYAKGKHEKIIRWLGRKFHQTSWTWEMVRQKWFELSNNEVDINNIHPFYQRNAVFMFICHHLADELNSEIYVKGLIMEFENMCSLIHFVNRKKWYTYNSWSLKDPRKIDKVKNQGQEGKKRDYCLWIRSILNFINVRLSKHRIVDESKSTFEEDIIRHFRLQLMRLFKYECTLLELQTSIGCKKMNQYKKDDTGAIVVMNFLIKNVGYHPIPQTRIFSVIRQPFNANESITNRMVPTIAMLTDKNVRYDRMAYLNRLKNPLSTLMLNFPRIAVKMKNILIACEDQIRISQPRKRPSSSTQQSNKKRMRIK